MICKKTWTEFLILFNVKNPFLKNRLWTLTHWGPEKAMAPHSSTLAWRIPWAEEAAVHGVAKSRTQLSDFTFTFHFHALEKEMATHSSVLAWRIPGTAEPGGLPSMGSHRVGHDWSDLAAVYIEIRASLPWPFWHVGQIILCYKRLPCLRSLAAPLPSAKCLQTLPNPLEGGKELSLVKVCALSCIQLFATSWTVAHQAPLSMGFSRREYWSGLPFPPLGDLPHPRT